MNNKAQFTPGPWIVNTFIVNGQQRLEVLDATGANACVQANANLIAAAPTMYADLCAVRDYLFELYDEGNAKAGEYAASLGITIEQAEGRHHE
jgi:hypothetical protein